MDKKVPVVGSGMVGFESAEFLAACGHKVAIIEMKNVIGEANSAPGNAVISAGDALNAALSIG